MLSPQTLVTEPLCTLQEVETSEYCPSWSTWPAVLLCQALLWLVQPSNELFVTAEWFYYLGVRYRRQRPLDTPHSGGHSQQSGYSKSYSGRDSLARENCKSVAVTSYSMFYGFCWALGRGN